MSTNGRNIKDVFPSLSKDIYVEKRRDRVLILDPSQPTWILTNANSANLIRLFNGKRSIGEVLNLFGELNSQQYRSAYSVIAKVLELGILWDKERPIRPVKPKTLGSVHLTLTRKCNLHCIYCYAESGNQSQSGLSVDRWRQIILDIHSVVGPLNFVLTGGESTIFKGFEKVAHYIRSLNCSVQLITNGCWESQVDYESIARLFNQIIVSIDGSSSAVNDFHRGIGSFDKSFRTVLLLRERNANVQVATVVTKFNAENLNDIRNLFEPMGVSVKFQPVYSLGRGSKQHDLLINGDEYYSALRKCSPSLKLFDNPPQLGVRVVSCGVGGGILSVDYDGTIYPCHLLHMGEHGFGKVTNTSFRSILAQIDASPYFNFNIDAIEQCSHCFIKYICGGNCRARALEHTGSLYSPDPFCDYFKKAILDYLFSSGEWIDGASYTAEK